MLFNSQLYLVFLAAVTALAWALARWHGVRLLWLLLASCVFYMAWDPRFIVLLLGAATWDWAVARRIEATPVARPGARKAWLACSLGLNLSVLGYFKYTNFFLQSVGEGLRACGIEAVLPVYDIVLPVGVSFFTFQAMAYAIDVYRSEIAAEQSLSRYLLFATFFPQMVAGPITRAHVLMPQLRAPARVDRADVSDALFRIGKGLAKKVIIADYLAVNVVDRVFSQPHLYSSAEVWVGLYAYSLQIYADFSGYTDIAIGSARLLGYRLPENFARPYRARSVAEFWRRWHITLSGWLRHYVFFPLGGSKGPAWRAHRNTMITLILIGLWHGASWNFVVYGVVHGLAISVNRLLHRRKPRGWNPDADPWPTQAWKLFATLQFVVLARILFRARQWTGAEAVWGALWTPDWTVGRIDGLTWAILLGGYGLHLLAPTHLENVRVRFVAWPAWAQGVALSAVGVVLATVAETDVVPFIYFQF
ncbi:MAG: MBOAT family protein [Myxococcales bacterium]|nr:MBOAT family protein [Myxococcales bacterium]